jgi:hypothetical protein
MTNGTIFLVIVIAAFVIFATQAGAKESKFLSSPFAAIFFLLVVGGVLFMLWSGASVAVLHH